MTRCAVCRGPLPDVAGGRKYCGMDCQCEGQARNRRARFANPEYRAALRAADRRSWARRRSRNQARGLRFTGRHQAAFDRAIVRWLLSDACRQFIVEHTAPWRRGA